MLVRVRAREPIHKCCEETVGDLLLSTIPVWELSDSPQFLSYHTDSHHTKTVESQRKLLLSRVKIARILLAD